MAFVFDPKQHIHGVDGDLVVACKPAGLPTTGHTLQDTHCLQHHLMTHFGGMVWALHQLDAETSGVSLFSRSKTLLNRVKARWAEPTIQKVYLAVVEGIPDWTHFEAQFPIGEWAPNRLGVTTAGRPAHTTFEVLSAISGYALIQCTLHTGRTHQIRIHLSHLGHSLVGEKWYRSEPSTAHPRQALHAWKISLPEIEGLSQRHWEAPLPDDFKGLLDRTGLCFRSTRFPKNCSSPSL